MIQNCIARQKPCRARCHHITAPRIVLWRSAAPYRSLYLCPYCDTKAAPNHDTNICIATPPLARLRALALPHALARGLVVWWPCWPCCGRVALGHTRLPDSIVAPLVVPSCPVSRYNPLYRDLVQKWAVAQPDFCFFYFYFFSLVASQLLHRCSSLNTATHTTQNFYELNFNPFPYANWNNFSEFHKTQLVHVQNWSYCPEFFFFLDHSTQKFSNT